VPAYCEVEGYVWRQVRFKAKLPEGWKGKILVIGSGGQAGYLPDDQYLGQPEALARGYVVVNHDSGHVSSVTDSLWGYDNEAAMIDYGFRGGHVAGIIGKAVAAAFYGRRPEHVYYHSCSNGGREALMMAQRYPSDYDGIIAGSPSLAYSDLFVQIYWIAELLKDRTRNGFDDIAAKVLHKAVLAQCHALDVHGDGVLEDPRLCKVDLSKVACKAATNDDCLTPHQVDIARNIYEGPRSADGRQIARPGPMPGSELRWAPSTISGPIVDYPQQVFRYLAFNPAPGPGWQPDPAKLGDYAKRMGLMDSLFSANNPDLRKFKANGGKLLVYFGWNDIYGVNDTIDYSESVERLMGGVEKTADFYRLFLMPGMNHCSGGDGASVFDYLGAMDSWVTAGKAPESLTGYHPREDGSHEFSRTVYPYHVTRANK
jgi:feruloyl esterase